MTLIIPCMPQDNYDEFYWKLNEPAGSTFGARQSPFGMAPTFAGATSWVRTSRGGQQGTGASATVSAWFYLTSVSTLSSFFQAVYGDGTTTPWYCLQLLQTGGDAGLFVEVNSTSSRNFANTNGKIVADARWQHAAMSYNSSTGLVKAYINGVKQYDAVFGSGSIVWGPSNSFIDVGTGILGSVCEVRLANTVRSDDYIRKMYLAGLGRMFRRGAS
jgi:hypothetical protein